MKMLGIISIVTFLFCGEISSITTSQKLLRRMKECDSLVCVGLDPDPSKFPMEISAIEEGEEEKAFRFLREIVDLTSGDVCAYKIQKAFFDSYARGHELLHDIIQYIKVSDENIPVIVDCKIGDTENTMQTYMSNLFSSLHADAVVINPYMGDDVFIPFMEDPEKCGVVLVQTSNPSAKIVQELCLEEGEMLWEKILSLVVSRWDINSNLIPVLSSNSDGTDYRGIRQMIPKDTPILLAGIGAQGGNLNVLSTLLNSERIGVFINSSRGILYPYTKDDPQWRDSVRLALIKLKEAIKEVQRVSE